ncbi:MAG TPA: TonB family protein [Myxococcota bacterium]|nr:TonB family protein [Myxococcota bacterium]HRY97095.1 TonB family protein [Myxococcota bacterium]HSA22240.1 TonB family protein [Myxococcota bacterium]
MRALCPSSLGASGLLTLLACLALGVAFPGGSLADVERPPSELAAPLSLTASDGTGLRLLVLEARAVVQPPLAFTELYLVFENPQDRVLEGQFRIALPQGASLSRFAMKLDDRWQEGEVLEKQAARRAYEDFLHRRQDPALLEQAAGNEFSARVFPIPARGRKELIISYSHELSQAEPFRVQLRGLPQLERFRGWVLLPTAGQSAPRVEQLERTAWVPDRDMEVAIPAEGQAPGLRSGDLLVSRVSPLLPREPAAVGGLVLLVDTSASRALGFEAGLRKLVDAVAELARLEGGGLPLLVVAFDQETELVYEGRADGFGTDALRALTRRRALGASDLHAALTWLGGYLPRAKARLPRVVVVSDGVTTAGPAEAAELAKAAAALAPLGVARLDAVAVGGIRDEAPLRAMVTAGLPEAGAVLDGDRPADVLAQRLRLRAAARVRVAVEGARWVWPEALEGLQAGDEALVYAEVPAGQPLLVTLDGKPVPPSGLALPAAERPLLERAAAKAHIDRLLDERDHLPAEAGERREALKREVIALSMRHRVLCPLTALLVLETEADYERYGIERKALADVLTVGSRGLEVLARSVPPPPPEVAKAPLATPDRSTRKDSMKMKKVAGRAGDARDSTLGAAEGDELAAEDAAAPRGADGSRVDSAESAQPLESLASGGAPGSAAPPPDARPASAPEPAPEPSVAPVVAAPPRAEPASEAREEEDRPAEQERQSAVERPAPARPRPAMRPAPDRRVRAQLSIASPEIQGSLDREVIMRVFRQRRGQLQSCYERGLRRNPTLEGRVTLRFTIDERGRVTEARSAPSALGDREVEACLVSRLKSWTFPGPQAGSVQIAFPLVFRPGERAVAPAVAAPDDVPGEDPYEGKLRDVMQLLGRKELVKARDLAFGWREEAPGDVLALVALGETAEAAKDLRGAARAYGSIIDLFPTRADLRRYAGQRLERLRSPAALGLAVDTYAKAAEQRPDHPASHRLAAMALLKAGKPAEAFAALERGLAQRYPGGRFAGYEQILAEDLGLAAAAWTRAEPRRQGEIAARLEKAGGRPENRASLRFVLVWETDANDVDFHIHDGRGGHAFYSQRTLASGGELYADVTTGYGPECFTIRTPPGKRAYPYRLQAHYYSRGPMGYGMGKLQIIEHDGRGGLRFEERPFVVMKDRAFVDLGTVRGPIK